MSEWIKTSEKYPISMDEVFGAWADDEGGYVYGVTVKNEQSEWFDLNGVDRGAPDYWMPIPEPPKQEHVDQIREGLKNETNL